MSGSEIRDSSPLRQGYRAQAFESALSTLAVALLLFTALLGGCGRGQKPEAKIEEKGVPVEVSPAQQGTMTETVTVTGTIRADRESSVTAQTSGRVLEVRVREGDTVSAGQVLIKLDPAESQSQVRQAQAGAEGAQARLEAAQRRMEIVVKGARQEERAIARNQIDQAESALRTADADLKRLTGLYAQGAISKQQLDGAQMAYDTTKAQRDSARKSLELMEQGARPEEIDAARKDVEAAAAGLRQASGMLAEAQERLSYTVIQSPINGMVFERNVEPGEIVGQGGSPLLRVADPSSVYYEATVPERVALRVKAGQRVEVMVQGDGERPVRGRVERLVTVANPNSRDFLVRIGITGGDAARTKPGVFARGAVVVQESQGAVIVPKDAVVERAGKPCVFVVEGGKAQQREVSVGITNNEQMEILSGVKPGESVVVIGAQGLQDGDAVQVKTSGGQ